MVIEKKPYVKYNLEKKDDIIRVRLNTYERGKLNEMREALDVESEAKALKFMALVGLNVLLGNFGRENLTYLFKKDRKRYTDFR